MRVRAEEGEGGGVGSRNHLGRTLGRHSMRYKYSCVTPAKREKAAKSISRSVDAANEALGTMTSVTVEGGIPNVTVPPFERK